VKAYLSVQRPVGFYRFFLLSYRNYKCRPYRIVVFKFKWQRPIVTTFDMLLAQNQIRLFVLSASTHIQQTLLSVWNHRNW